jgi:tetratricopeptide (TPR) repeat protein
MRPVFLSSATTWLGNVFVPWGRQHRQSSPSCAQRSPHLTLTRLASALRWWPLALGSSLCLAQGAPADPTPTETARAPSAAVALSPSENRLLTSAMTAEVMYLVLVGEMRTLSGQAGAGYSLLLDAARKSADPLLYRRAVEIAMQSGSGEAAISAAKAWASADKASTEPLRVMLQIMLSLNQVEQSESTLEQLLDRVPDAERSELVDLVGHNYARAKDKSAAVRVLTSALRLWQRNSASASSAWTALARVQVAAGLAEAATHSLEKALQAAPETPAAGLLAVELLGATQHPLPEAKLQSHLSDFPEQHLVRMAYARYLLGASRWTDSERQLQHITQRQPSLAEAWLMLGALQLQNNQLAPAHDSLNQFLNQASHIEADRRDKALTQAYLLLAQIEEQRQNPAQARAWLDRIDTSDDMLRIQLRRASLLAREGKLEQARALIQDAPASQASEVRAKVLAEAQLLKDARQTQAAFDVLSNAVQAAPDDTDLMYEQAMVAEKLGRHADMERLLRRVIALSPDNAHAHNALGYAMADRNDRLPEAKALIVKALSLLPDDPFITDSLGWVEFRLGNLPEAARLLRKALAMRTDIEILTHLAEVLWAMGERDHAKDLFRQASTLQPDNEVLQSTLTRLGVRL